VVRSDGRFGGEKKAAEARRKVVVEEGIPMQNDRVRMRNDILF